MDEAEVARAIADEDLTSPQQYGNGWLFNLRITGTGTAYRQSLKEFVWRDPSLYMNQGFLDRCQGLPVIIEHPDKLMLDGGEFTDRVVGMIVYPYLRKEENEVWGIGRILNQRAAKYMREHQLSTSPAVVFKDGDEINDREELKDGKHLLIEGKPSLLDHLAICEEGVWDKGGPPTGVDLTGERKMADEKDREEDRQDRRRADETEDEKNKREEEDKRADADDTKIDKLLSGLDSMHKRMDAFEARHGRRDATAEEEEEQAEELHELAEEEEEEAKEAKEEDRVDKRKDEAYADEEDERKVPYDKAKRLEGESDSRYSKRMDAAGKEHEDGRFLKRDDESVAAHCDRVARDARRDSARRDAEEQLDKTKKEAEEARADAAEARREGREVRRLLDEMKGTLADRTPDDEAAFADAQARADTNYMALGQRAPASLRGETLVGYRTRLARGMQSHSKLWKDEDLSRLARHSPSAFEAAEQAIYADAMMASKEPLSVPGGGLRQIIRHREGGGQMYDFVGDPRAWMQDFMPPAEMFAVRIGGKE